MDCVSEVGVGERFDVSEHLIVHIEACCRIVWRFRTEICMNRHTAIAAFV